MHYVRPSYNKRKVCRFLETFTSPAGAVAKYCDEYVCLSVREDISGTTCAIFTKFLCMLSIIIIIIIITGVLKWSKQQRHQEDHYNQSKYEQYQSVL